MILNGVEIAQKELKALSKSVEAIQKSGTRLTLASVQVGEPQDASVYSRSIGRVLQNIHVGYAPRVFQEKISEAELTREILKLNADPEITAMMVFSPLPAHLNPVFILSAIDVWKDVEGRCILQGSGDRVLSPTAGAVMALLEETGVEISGKEAVVIGRSEGVGKPSAILLLDRRATVTVCHSKTKNLREHVERADIVVATLGKPEFVKGAWIKPGAVVIDVGENVVDGKLVGDVEFEAAKERAGHISPVPGGVGPVTNVMLVKNLVTLYKTSHPQWK